MQKWSFEVWNELWGLSWPIDYMALFNASSRAVKAVHSSLRVGGPATASLAHVSDFVAACDADGIAYDFASTHHYPTDSCPRGVSWDPSCFARDVLRVRRTVPDTLPFLLTEYNVGCCLGYVGHDVATAAAFIFRTVSELNDHLDIYSYWTFTDVFEEGGLPREEFKNVYGAMSVGGIPKPAFRAFELLHAHAGDRRLPVAIEHHPTVHPTVAQELPNVSTSHPRHWAVGVPCNVSDDTQLGWTFRGGALAWVPPRASRVEAETQRGEVMPAIFGGSSSGGDGLVAGTTALCRDSAAGDARMQLLPCEYLQPSQEFARGKAASFRQRGKCLAVSHLDLLTTAVSTSLSAVAVRPSSSASREARVERRRGGRDRRGRHVVRVRHLTNSYPRVGLASGAKPASGPTAAAAAAHAASASDVLRLSTRHNQRQCDGDGQRCNGCEGWVCHGGSLAGAHLVPRHPPRLPQLLG